jgi:hypothetical protein
VRRSRTCSVGLSPQHRKLLRDGDIDELVERDAFLVGKLSCFVEKRRLQPQSKIISSYAFFA